MTALVSLVSNLVFGNLSDRTRSRFGKRSPWVVCGGVLGGLSLFAMSSVNLVGCIAVVSLSACISLLFPTIYGEALKGLGADTKFGAAGLVMAIIGGATMPLVQSWVIDHSNAALSYGVVAVCMAVPAAYAVYTLRLKDPEKSSEA